MSVGRKDTSFIKYVPGERDPWDFPYVRYNKKPGHRPAIDVTVERAENALREGKTASDQRYASYMLQKAGHRGITAVELRDRDGSGRQWMAADGALSVMGFCRVIQRLKETRGHTNAHVYVLHRFVDGREISDNFPQNMSFDTEEARDRARAIVRGINRRMGTDMEKPGDREVANKLMYLAGIKK